MCAHNLFFFRKSKKNITIFHLKIDIFTSVNTAVLIIIAYAYYRNEHFLPSASLSLIGKNFLPCLKHNSLPTTQAEWMK